MMNFFLSWKNFNMPNQRQIRQSMNLIVNQLIVNQLVVNQLVVFQIYSPMSHLIFQKMIWKNQHLNKPLDLESRAPAHQDQMILERDPMQWKPQWKLLSKKSFCMILQKFFQGSFFGLKRHKNRNKCFNRLRYIKIVFSVYRVLDLSYSRFTVLSVYRILGLPYSRFTVFSVFKIYFRPNFLNSNEKEVPRKRAKNPSGDHSNDNLNDHQNEKDDQGENSIVDNFDPSGDQG